MLLVYILKILTYQPKNKIMLVFIILLVVIYIFFSNQNTNKKSTKNRRYSPPYNEQNYFEMGKIFEDFVRFKYYGANYETTHVTPSYEENCLEFNDESYKPDLKFLDPDTGKEFWVECKFRTYYQNQKDYIIISENQLRRHRSITDSPVYVMLGIGGKPNKPLYLYKIPISKCRPVMKIGHLYHQFQINR